MTMTQFADDLQGVAAGYIFYPVLDGTGLKGGYGFTLSFRGLNKIKSVAIDSESSDPNGALTIFAAVSRQLGLKLEKQKRPQPVLVIEHIDETPTEN